MSAPRTSPRAVSSLCRMPADVISLGQRREPVSRTSIDVEPTHGLCSHHRLMGLTNTPSDLLPGTLELLILKALARGSKHGYGIVEHLRLASADVLQVGESALYPALQRILLNGWAKAEWGASENNRRARYYTLT